MMKKTLLTILVAVCWLPGAAQTAGSRPQQSVYLELLGASNLVGVNYDARFKAGTPWGYRVGLGYTYSENYNMFSGSNSLRGPDVPLELNCLLGRKRAKFELGLGLNLGYYTEKYDTWTLRQRSSIGGIPFYETEYAGETRHSTLGYYLFTDVGYRFQPLRGFQFRVGISPSFNLGGSHAVSKVQILYLSFGYAF